MLALSLLGGCAERRGVRANYRALEDLQLVETLGLDRAERGALTLSASGKVSSEGMPLILQAQGGSLTQGLEALQDRALSGQVFFAHTQYIVLGEACAAGGIGPLLDYVERDIHTRMGTRLFVLRGGDASSFLTGAGPDWDAGSVLSSVCADAALRGDRRVFDVRETAVALSEYGAALICALRLIAAQDGDGGAGPGLSAVPAGFGVLRSGRLVAFLDSGEAMAAALLLGTPGSVPLRVSDVSGGAATLELRCDQPEIRCALGPNGRVTLTLRAAPEAAIAELDPGLDAEDPAVQSALADAADRALTEAIRGVFARAQALDADFLALGRALRQDGIDPDALPPDWLRGLTLSVRVETTLTRSYDLGQGAETDGGGDAHGTA